MNVNELKLWESLGIVKYHHTAATRGYISRLSKGYVCGYVGRFGIGYALYTPRWDTTNYHYVSYYIFTNVVNVNFM